MSILDVKKDVSYCVGSFGEGLDHPECVTWGSDGYAYAGGEGGQLYRINVAENEFEQFSQAPQFVGGMCQDGSGNLYFCSGNKVYKATAQGEVSEYSSGTTDAPLMGPNYPAFDKDGNLYVTDSGEWEKDNGRIFKISPGGLTKIWSEAVQTFPNGICLSSDGSFLYVAVSLNPPRIERIPIGPEGEAGKPEIVVDMPKTVPDGLAFDSVGNLYISCYRPDSIFRLDPEGTLEVLAQDYEGTLMAAPTNIAFCGDNLDDLLSANLGRWHISRYNLKASGLPLNYPVI
ncbi:MAG: SMP-30/gluconolactonase/LRE family protein [Chloroflexota bacterium]|jgi:gluconolactonase|nr:SMP-30/gluconolactonase/LRE family protein [Chloroflexota bacterium]MEC9279048.1 SMP-30/gluconolactonase/LRE family protein [Chloroflexota bacterium]|tara:strand:- start:625 stop:1485 length:861 start_codon:yes stop_codon:yes gene_type:complete